MSTDAAVSSSPSLTTVSNHVRAAQKRRPRTALRERRSPLSGVRQVATKPSFMSESATPSAHKIPGESRIRIFRMASSRATSTACRPPAPPKGMREKSRGSWPRSIDTARIARTMLDVMIRRMQRCFVQAEIELPGEQLHNACGSGLVHGHGSADKRLWQATENDIGIRNRRFRSATLVASWSGHCARTHRTDLQQPVRTNKCDGAAAGSNGVNIDRWKANGKIRNVAAISYARNAVLDQTDVRARTADIECNEVAFERPRGDRYCTHHTRCGTRQYGANRQFGGAINVHQAACGLANSDRGSSRLPGKRCLETLQIAGHLRLQE